MMISGKKIVELEQQEKEHLRNAVSVLLELSESIGNDEWDFADLADTLSCIAHEDKFEVDFEQ
jgi:hypothetical protein